MTDARWFFARNKQKVGPFSFAQLQELAAAGELQPADMVYCEGAARWQAAASVPGLLPVTNSVPQLTVDHPAMDCRYWLLLNGGRQGPYPAIQIRAWLEAGQVSGDSLGCPEQGGDWAPLVRLFPNANAPNPVATPVYSPVLVEESISVRPMPSPRQESPPEAIPCAIPATPPGIGGTQRTGVLADSIPRAVPILEQPRPWNPVAIVWLGLLFSPLWAGIMAAVNGRRLDPHYPWWRPAGIGVGALVLYLVIDLTWGWYVGELLLYLAAVGLLGLTEVGPQSQAYRLHVGAFRRTAGWLVPALAGTPLSLCAFLGLVIFPLLPLEPRQVCERFSLAKTEQEMKRYTTLKLWPALATLEKQTFKPGGSEVHFELTHEGPAPPDLGGYVVGFRLLFVEHGRHHQVEGMFLLVQRDGEWKIEDMFITTADRQPLNPCFALSLDYLQLAEANQPPPGPGGNPAQKPANQQQSAVENRQVHQMTRGLAPLLSSKSGKGIGLALVAILAAIVGFGKKVLAFFAGASARSVTAKPAERPKT